MDKQTQGAEKIWVVVNDDMAITRGGGPKQLPVQELTVNITNFLEQISVVLDNTPETLGKFHLDELEIHAEITAQGAIALLGTGLQAGTSGGLRFVFRRSSTPS